MLAEVGSPARQVDPLPDRPHKRLTLLRQVDFKFPAALDFSVARTGSERRPLAFFTDSCCASQLQSSRQAFAGQVEAHFPS